MQILSRAMNENNRYIEELFNFLGSQVLDLWRKQLNVSMTVKQFVEEVKLWERKGFVKSGIWRDLKPYLQLHLLPTGIISFICR